MDQQMPGTGTLGTSSDRLAVLVIHADKSFCQQLTDAMEQESVDTHSVATAVEAQEQLARRGYDAVVLDESLPGTSHEPLWELLALRLPAGTALYLVSDRADPQVMGQFQTRIKALFQKPFETEVLLSDVRAYIREKKLYGSKRKSDRIPFFAEARFTDASGRLVSEAMLLNMSVGGFFAVLPKGTKLPDRGSVLHYSIVIPGQEPLAGRCSLQWLQREGSVGCGCEFHAPAAETLERVCSLLNSVRTRQVGPQLRSPVAVADLTRQVARVQSWLENRPVALSDFAVVCDAEITCFSPLLLANLAGVVRGFGSNCCQEGATITLDVATSERAVEFQLACASPTVSLGAMMAIDKLMPKLQLAGGGREILTMHNANVEFSLREGGPQVCFRVPLHPR